MILNFQLTNSKHLNDTVLLIVQFLPSLTITLLSVVVPAVFNKVVVAEDYMPAFAIRITLIRFAKNRKRSFCLLCFCCSSRLLPEVCT